MTINELNTYAVQMQFHPVTLAIRDFATEYQTALALTLGAFAIWLLKDGLNMTQDEAK